MGVGRVFGRETKEKWSARGEEICWFFVCRVSIVVFGVEHSRACGLMGGGWRSDVCFSYLVLGGGYGSGLLSSGE